MSEFMKCIMTNYVMYFNDQNNRVGGLFQGRYKALLVEGDDQLLHLSRYIHLNPTELLGSDPCKALAGYDYSSFQDYIGARNTKWMKPEFVLRLNDEEVSGDLETKKKTYKNFVSEYAKDREAIKENLGNLVLE